MQERDGVREAKGNRYARLLGEKADFAVEEKEILNNFSL